MAQKGRIVLTGAERQARLRARQLAEAQAREAQLVTLREALAQVVGAAEELARTKQEMLAQLDLVAGLARRALAHGEPAA